MHPFAPFPYTFVARNLRHGGSFLSRLPRLRFPWIHPATYPSAMAPEGMELGNMLLHYVGLHIVSESIRQFGGVGGPRHQLGTSLV